MVIIIMIMIMKMGETESRAFKQKHILVLVFISRLVPQRMTFQISDIHNNLIRVAASSQDGHTFPVKKNKK